MRQQQYKLSGIKPMQMDTLKRLNGKPVEPKGTVDVAKGIDDEQVFRESYEKHSFKHALHVANAARTLQHLPEPGEVIHVLMSGNFAGWDWVSAILRLAAPETIDQLYVATLGFSERNAGELLTLLDAGTIKRVAFLCSDYMAKQDSEIFVPLAEALTKRGHRIVSMRNHAKLIAMKLTDGRTFTIDGSMNLRSCRNVEQCNISSSPELFSFYKTYIEGSCTKGAA